MTFMEKGIAEEIPSNKGCKYILNSVCNLLAKCENLLKDKK